MQDAEKVRQHRSRIIQTISIPKGTPPAFSRGSRVGLTFTHLVGRYPASR